MASDARIVAQRELLLEVKRQKVYKGIKIEIKRLEIENRFDLDIT